MSETKVPRPRGRAKARPAPPPEPKLLMRPADLAAQLGITLDTLGLWRAQGRGPAFIRRSRFIWYRTAAVEQWLTDGEVLRDKVNG